MFAQSSERALAVIKALWHTAFVRFVFSLLISAGLKYLSIRNPFGSMEPRPGASQEAPRRAAAARERRRRSGAALELSRRAAPRGANRARLQGCSWAELRRSGLTALGPRVWF